MEKKTIVNVVGGDDTLEICKAIVKTHEYCIMNLDILSHHIDYEDYYYHCVRPVDRVSLVGHVDGNTGNER